LKEDHLAFRSSEITGGHCYFRNFKSPKLRNALIRWELEAYHADRNRTAEVFEPYIAVGPPELRRPRFSFLYDQLVKEPTPGARHQDGGGFRHP